MKYIRTKDGIWQLDDLGCVHHPYNGMPIHKSYLEIIKEADTIEELCDGYELIEEIDNVIIYEYFDNTKYCDNGAYEKIMNEISYCKNIKINHKVKGYIRTDKGLIYVAKMNDKGELELL